MKALTPPFLFLLLNTLLGAPAANASEVTVVDGAYADDGHGLGNGGGTLAAHFSSVMTATYKQYVRQCGLNQVRRDPRFRTVCLASKSKKWTTALSASVKESNIKSGPDAVLGPDGQFREAANYPKQNLIRFRGYVYRALKPEGILKLVLHEYASLAGLDASDRYEGSNAILELLLEDAKVEVAKLVDPLPKRDQPEEFSLTSVCFQNLAVCSDFAGTFGRWRNPGIFVKVGCYAAADYADSLSEGPCGTPWVAITTVSITNPQIQPEYSLADISALPRCDAAVELAFLLGTPEYEVAPSCVDGILKTKLLIH